jgi:hypothetical protein
MAGSPVILKIKNEKVSIKKSVKLALASRVIK